MIPSRLLVPLKTEHYQAFESGTKEWVLRGYDDRFNERTVFERREIELRRGYSMGASLWGRITDVEVFSTVTEIPARIDLELLLPGRTQTEFLDSVAERLGEFDQWIAFRVELEDS